MTGGALPVQHALFRAVDAQGDELLFVFLVDGRCAITRGGIVLIASDCTTRGIRRLVDRFHRMTRREPGKTPLPPRS